MWTDLAAAVCLALVLEGLLPFLMPRRWQQAISALALLEPRQPRQLRWLGLGSMVLGAILLYWVRTE